jgi:hypothetical protein
MQTKACGLLLAYPRVPSWRIVENRGGPSIYIDCVSANQMNEGYLHTVESNSIWAEVRFDKSIFSTEEVELVVVIGGPADRGMFDVRAV